MLPVGDSREGRACGEQRQKPWRTMDIGNYPRKESQELTLRPGQGSHRACPAGFNDHSIKWLWLFTIYFLYKWESFVCLFPVMEFLLHHCLLDVMGKTEQRTYFSSSKPLTPWREINLMERVMFITSYADIGVWCGNCIRVLVVFFGESERYWKADANWYTVKGREDCDKPWCFRTKIVSFF